MSQAEPEQESGSGKAENDLWECPECGDGIDRRGAIGHLRFEHDIPNDQAKEIYASSKNSSSNGVGGGGSEAASGDPTLPSDDAPIDSGDRGRDSVDKTIDDILKRYDQQAKIQMVKELAQEDDGGDLDKIEKIIEISDKLGADDGGDDKMAQAVMRLAENMNQPQQPVADGGGSVVENAVANGVDDPEALRELAELDPKRREIEQKYEFRQDLIDRIGKAFSRLPEGVISSMVGGVLQQATEQSAQPREREPETTEVRESPDRETVEEASSPHAEEMSVEGGGSNE